MIWGYPYFWKHPNIQVGCFFLVSQIDHGLLLFFKYRQAGGWTTPTSKGRTSILKWNTSNENHVFFERPRNFVGLVLRYYLTWLYHLPCADVIIITLGGKYTPQVTTTSSFNVTEGAFGIGKKGMKGWSISTCSVLASKKGGWGKLGRFGRDFFIFDKKRDNCEVPLSRN